jgi:chlorite dismutase
VEQRFLSHFTMCRFTDSYWALEPEKRLSFHEAWLRDFETITRNYSLWQIFPTSVEADFLLWTSIIVDETGDPARFFERFAHGMNQHRQFIQPVEMMWGFTRPSDYARGKSAQEIDPLEQTHKQYLVIYPFVKTAEWYKLSRDTRQGMMNEHIRTGHQYPQITQLLLYSTGLQDQEFVVVYETDDLPLFSKLVTDLRGSEARRFTERDTPIFTAIFHEPQETLALLSGGNRP